MHLITVHEFSTYTHLMRLPALLAFAVWSFTASAEILGGRVVAVADGDTITLLDSNRQQHRIRLAGIDAPEKGQPYGQRSKEHISDLAFGKNAKADCYKVDQYGREVCSVYVDGKDVGLAQLDGGLAWWFRKYAHEQPPRERIDYEAAEDRAAADRDLPATAWPLRTRPEVEHR